MSNIGVAFQAFALILLPILLFLGATFGRVLESPIEDYFYLGGINRIHHFYAAAAPVLAAYFVISPYDDFKGRMRSMAVAPSSWQMLFTGTAMVGGINSLLAAVFAVLLASWLLTWAIPLSVLVGAAVFCERRRPRSLASVGMAQVRDSRTTFVPDSTLSEPGAPYLGD
jgi:hypothetical protein